MPNILTNLELDELSLVDNPANPLAKAPLYKRDSKGDNMEELDQLKVKVDALGKEKERLIKALIDNGFVVSADAIEKKEVVKVDQIEVEGELINKSDLPAPVLKALEAAAVAKSEAEVEKKDAEITKLATEKLPHWDIEAAKSILKTNPDDKLWEALMAADAAFESIMTEKGESSVDDMASPKDKLDALVKAHQAEAKVTYAKAYAAIVKTDAGKALVKQLYKKEA